MPLLEETNKKGWITHQNISFVQLLFILCTFFLYINNNSKVEFTMQQINGFSHILTSPVTK